MSARNIHVSVLVDTEVRSSAEALRDSGRFVTESTSSLYYRLIRHGLRHKDCKEGKLEGD